MFVCVIVFECACVLVFVCVFVSGFSKGGNCLCIFFLRRGCCAGVRAAAALGDRESSCAERLWGGGSPVREVGLLQRLEESLVRVPRDLFNAVVVVLANACQLRFVPAVAHEVERRALLSEPPSAAHAMDVRLIVWLPRFRGR